MGDDDRDELRRLALLHGIQPTWTDVFGRERHVPDKSLRMLLEAFDVDAGSSARTANAAAVRAQAVPQGRRIWGPAVQLYAMRSQRNWGIGDWSDLLRLAELWAPLGAGVIGVSPLHALFSARPEHTSPYSPSSRLWLNIVYLDVTAIEDVAEATDAAGLMASTAFQRRLDALRAQPLVDYAGVMAVKLDVLRSLHRSFRQRHANDSTVRGASFRSFQDAAGTALQAHARFEALDAHFRSSLPDGHGWPAWPDAFHDPRSRAVDDFARVHAEEVEFHAWLQWQADLQLARVQQRCKSLGMGIGLYLDMAVSVDPSGSDTWSRASLFARNAGIGAPPDEFNPKGQNWGLAPLRPDRLRADTGFFAETVRRVMRSAGAVRIDHVMGLMRLFWVPEGCDAGQGAYVHLPFDTLLEVIVQESRRTKTVVIGEDLGTVDPDAQRTLADRGVLSYRLVYFERETGGDFKPSHDYPAQALAAISTHDLPTFSGWWTGHDLAV